jgi:hypothetical protein
MTRKTSKPASTRTPEQRKPGTASDSEQKPWMKHIGKLKPSPKETERIDKRIEEAFEKIDEESWGPQTNHVEPEANDRS